MEIVSLVLATSNEHKVEEMGELLGEGFQIYSLKDIKYSGPPPEENGETFRENANIKAITIGQAVQLPTLSDDSGFEVEAMGNKPGIHSARFGNTSDQGLQRKMILDTLTDSSDRRARFVCELSFFDPLSDMTLNFRGTVEGYVANEERGKNGFGYDSIFIPEGFSQTFGEMSAGEKNRLSHRAKAVESLRKSINLTNSV